MKEQNLSNDAANFRSEGSLPPELTLSKEIDLSGKSAIVTGGSRGIGRAIVLKLAYHGASVVFNSTSSSAAEAAEVVKDVESMGKKAVYIEGDIRDDNIRKALCDTAVSEFGGLDILVNNAAITRDQLVIRMKEDEWHDVIGVNLDATFFMMQKAAKIMLKNRAGQIINISSDSSHGLEGQANYAASKAGMKAAGNALARELGTRGVCVNSVELGLVDEKTKLTEKLTDDQQSGFIDLASTKKAVRMEEAADLVTYIASGRLSGLTRQTINLDGGMLK